MATFTVSISNTVTLFGPASTSLWDSAVWDTDVWGSDSNLDFSVGKALDSESISISDQFSNFYKKPLTSETISLSDSYTISRSHGDDVFDFVRDAVDNFSKVADGTDSFSTLTATSTIWTKL